MKAQHPRSKSKVPGNSNAAIQAIAADWMARFDATNHPERLWPTFRAWMDEHPAHREAVRHAGALWRIKDAVSRCLEPSADAQERREARETFEAELAAYPDLFWK
jgi:ferric-dicitrate binding protein FerR (iron transport regulator)